MRIRTKREYLTAEKTLLTCEVVQGVGRKAGKTVKVENLTGGEKKRIAHRMAHAVLAKQDKIKKSAARGARSMRGVRVYTDEEKAAFIAGRTDI